MTFYSPHHAPIRQVIYTSRGITTQAEQHRILKAARSFNGINGVTGLLWTDGHRFLQALEGPPDAVQVAVDRICTDQRHSDLEFHRDRIVDYKEFGDWSMAMADELEEKDITLARLMVSLVDATVDTRNYFINNTNNIN